jgi:hypothetical protein
MQYAIHPLRLPREKGKPDVWTFVWRCMCCDEMNGPFRTQEDAVAAAEAAFVEIEAPEEVHH